MEKLLKARTILLEGKAWNKNGKTNSKVDSTLADLIIFEIFIDSTSFLPVESNKFQRLYHVYNLTKIVPICPICYKYNSFVKSYNKTCGDKICHHKLKALLGGKTKSIIDESGTSIASRSTKKAMETMRNTIDIKTGKTLLKLNGEKILASNSKIDLLTGLTPLQIGGKKSSHTKRNTIDSDGLNISQKSRIKQIDTLKSEIDIKTGLSRFDLVRNNISISLKNSDLNKFAAIRNGIKRSNTICENGLSIASNAAYKGVLKCRITKEINGSMIPLSEYSNWELYCKHVSTYTFNNNLKTLENWDLRGNHATNKDAWHLDHIVSVIDGFKNNVLPSIIGSIHNLRMIPWRDNISKGGKSDMSIEELNTKCTL